MLKELFPSWEAVQRYREVVIFVVGLMKDPRPLVQHVYEMQIEDYLNKMRNRKYPPIDADLFRSLHSESKIRLVDHPLHNKYINYYNHEMDEERKRTFDTNPVYYPCEIYHFNEMRHQVELEDPQREATEVPPCAMTIWCPHKTVSDVVLSICSEIFKHQVLTDLYMIGVACNFLEAPILINPMSVSLIECELPDGLMEKIFHQLFDCGKSLQWLMLSAMNLTPFESLLDELLGDLVAHHEVGLAQRKLVLWLKGFEDEPTNLSEDFKKKWRNRCDGIKSIDCNII